MRKLRFWVPFRGQAEAPLELVIAVIILAASMALAFLVMFRATEVQCIAQLRSETRGLENAILDVAQGSPPTQRVVNYELPVCREQVVEAVQFVYFSDPNFCSQCVGSFGGCWKIQPTIKDQAGRYTSLSEASTCINIAGSIELVQDESPGCQTLSDNPCPTGDWSSCNSDYTASPETSAKIQQTSRFATLGKFGNIRLYNVTIRKEIILGAGGSEVTNIKICARPIGAR
jgi:hypothetical protein